MPGLKEFAEFFVSDELAGPDGPLAAYGLVADPELAATQAAVAAETTIAQRSGGRGPRVPRPLHSQSRRPQMPLSWTMPIILAFHGAGYC